MTEVPMPSPEDLRTYLELRGWQVEDGGRNASLWYNAQRPTDGTLVLVPHVGTASDYPDRVSMLLQELSRVHREPVENLRREATLVHFDVIPVRAADADIDDTIPLHAGLELYGAVRKVVVAAAGATIRRASHFSRSLPSAARDHSHVVRLGQTERGSYIVPIISRARFAPGEATAAPNQHLDIEAEELLFDRRVVSTMATALGRLQELAAPSRPPQESELSRAVSVGVSRELCSGVSKALKAPSISNLSVDFKWAPATAQPRDTPGSVEFTDDQRESLDAIGERLRVLDLPREDVLYGLVTELRHRPNDPERRVGVEALVGHRVRTVFMRLTPEQYEIAQQCHERSKVIVRGQLRAPSGQRAEMMVDYFGPDTSLLDIQVKGAETSP